MNSYPADQQTISDVERGRRWNAILPFPPGKSLSPGDSIVFSLAQARANQAPCYVAGGDSVRVSLTKIVDLELTDPSTGQALFQLVWEPPGRP
jgi:hypothetical protein